MNHCRPAGTPRLKSLRPCAGSLSLVRSLAEKHSVDDDQPEILSADDVCPFCGAVMTDRGEFAGVWDGSLGQGCGNWYIAKCRTCGAGLVGWEFAADAEEVHVRWNGRRHGPATAGNQGQGYVFYHSQCTE
jgi:hypothetical protein